MTVYILYHKSNEYYNNNIEIIGSSCNKETLESVKREMIHQDKIETKNRHESIIRRDDAYDKFTAECDDFLLRNIENMYGYKERLENLKVYYGRLITIDEINQEFLRQITWSGYHKFEKGDFSEYLDISNISESPPICPELPEIPDKISTKYTEDSLIIEEIKDFDQ